MKAEEDNNAKRKRSANKSRKTRKTQTEKLAKRLRQNVSDKPQEA